MRYHPDTAEVPVEAIGDLIGFVMRHSTEERATEDLLRSVKQAQHAIHRFDRLEALTQHDRLVCLNCDEFVFVTWAEDADTSSHQMECGCMGRDGSEDIPAEWCPLRREEDL